MAERDRGRAARSGSRHAAARADDVGRLRRLAAQRRPAGAVADGLVARLVDAAHVDPAGDRAGRLRGRRAAAPAGDSRLERRSSSSAAAVRRRVARSASRVSAAYASLISAMRRVATRDAAGSSPVRSGWLVRARRRQAALIWVGDAPGFDTEDVTRISFGHHAECRARASAAAAATVRQAPRSVPSPTGVGNHPPSWHRRGRRRRAARARLPLRARLSRPRRLPAPQPAADHAGRPRPAVRIDARSSPTGCPLPAWFIPARGGAPGPGVVLVHGWESARDRTLPLAVFLHAAGFHCLTFDVRGNGANPAEDAAAQRRRVRRRRAGRLPGARRTARGDGRRRSPAIRWAPSGRSSRRPPTRGSRRSSRPPARPTRTASPGRRSASPACRSPT